MLKKYYKTLVSFILSYFKVTLDIVRLAYSRAFHDSQDEFSVVLFSDFHC